MGYDLCFSALNDFTIPSNHIGHDSLSFLYHCFLPMLSHVNIATLFILFVLYLSFNLIYYFFYVMLIKRDGNTLLITTETVRAMALAHSQAQCILADPSLTTIWRHLPKQVVKS